MQDRTWTDKDIMKALQESEASRNAALRYVYEKLNWEGLVVAFILQRGGNEQDALEVANDALVAFDKNIRQGKFKSGSSLQTYFVSIARNRWLNQQRGKKLFEEYDPQQHGGMDQTKEDAIVMEEKLKYLELSTSVLGEKCQHLFRLKQWGYAGDVIAEELGLKNANMVKKAYFRCRQRFIEYLTENPGWRDLIN
jgi:RNA polymerase sigma factor (sigma-70 family)